MLDFDELRELAADVRVFVDLAEDKAEALRAVIAAYDVVLAIFPSEKGYGPPRHQRQPDPGQDCRKSHRSHAMYSHTAIAVP